MICDLCRNDCTIEHERINPETVYCLNCWEAKCDAYEARIEDLYYREDGRR